MTNRQKSTSDIESPGDDALGLFLPWVADWFREEIGEPTPPQRQAWPAIARGEFGGVGTRRILALLRRHGIRSTWFIPGVTIATYPQACEAVVADGHEIANQSVHDRTPDQLGSWQMI
ncbi:MAG: polysaccharide deacetylase family protein, partial [Acidobacteria bacterium]|nr:polysaccharide deacetylase family protein [Acidobacteriota bacterium]